MSYVILHQQLKITFRKSLPPPEKIHPPFLLSHPPTPRPHTHTQTPLKIYKVQVPPFLLTLKIFQVTLPLPASPSPPILPCRYVGRTLPKHSIDRQFHSLAVQGKMLLTQTSFNSCISVFVAYTIITSSNSEHQPRHGSNISCMAVW